MSKELTAGELHDLKQAYRNDKHVESLVGQMAQLYQQFARPITRDKGIQSVLSPTAQRRWNVLDEQLKEYKRTHYRPLFPEE